MTIQPVDLVLMRLNVIANLGMKLMDVLWWTAMAMLIASGSLWLAGVAVLKLTTAAGRVWRWCATLQVWHVIGLLTISLAMLAYFAGVYALAQRH
jgi:hypothetical protein